MVHQGTELDGIYSAGQRAGPLQGKVLVN